jgi:hypothetical protein
MHFGRNNSTKNLHAAEVTQQKLNKKLTRHNRNPTNTQQKTYIAPATSRTAKAARVHAMNFKECPVRGAAVRQASEELPGHADCRDYAAALEA